MVFGFLEDSYRAHFYGLAPLMTFTTSFEDGGDNGIDGTLNYILTESKFDRLKQFLSPRCLIIHTSYFESSQKMRL